MGKVVVSEFASLDGVVEAPGRFGDFKHRGWTFEIDRGEEVERFKDVRESPVYGELLAEAVGAEALLLGRVTYEELAALWPSRDGELADNLNGLRKYVVSSTLEDPEWSNSTVLEGDVIEEVSRLRRELDGDIVVAGSVRLARALLEHDLVDEIRLRVFPVVLGGGERLFDATGDRKPLRLVDTRSVGDAVALLTYETIRDSVEP